MIGKPKTDSLKSSIVSCVSHEGLTIKTRTGQIAYLAIVNVTGEILEAGPQVSREIWHVAITSYKNFLVGQGHLRIFSRPPNTENDETESM